MVDLCKECIMVDRIKRIEDFADKNEIKRDGIEKVVYEIKSGHEKTQISVEQMLKSQEAQALATERRENAYALATEKNQDLVALMNKENKELIENGFKVIADKKLEEEKEQKERKRAYEIERKRVKEAQEVERVRLSELQIIRDENAAKEKVRLSEAQAAKDAKAKADKLADRKEKRKTRIGIYIAIFLMALNYATGLLIKYAPHLINLPN